MTGRVTSAALLASAALVVCAAAPAPSARAPLPPSTLAVRVGDAWRTWWSSDRAPDRWRAPDPALSAAARWTPVADGVDWTELRLAGQGEAWRLRAIAVRIDPSRVRLRLVNRLTGDGMRGLWTVDDAPAEALVAVNVGHFVRGSPWGWLVVDGLERLSPGTGPLSLALSVDARGAVAWHAPAALTPDAAAPRLAARLAFQSYPVLAHDDGVVPVPLRADGRGVDVRHRDTRLAIGELRDGRLLVVLTRWDALGPALGQAPFGLTIPELAALMGGLGCRTAVALDGGTSAQLRLRGPGTDEIWRGLRRVPVGLLVLPR